MTTFKPLDQNADVLPYGLLGTPFETVFKALQNVAADVWAVDPSVYRAGIAWGWYALHAPEALSGRRELLIAALISEQAPLIKASQTTEELVQYLTRWRVYTPTFPKLEALFGLFGVSADIRPISDADSQTILPVTDTRNAFYVRITGMDWARPFELSEASTLAVRATPLGARPVPYYAFTSAVSVYAGASSAGAVYRVHADTPATVPSSNDYGYMTDSADFTFEAPRGVIDMGSLGLVYGGGEQQYFEAPRGVIDMGSLGLVYGGGEQQYMVENTEIKGYLRSSAYQGSDKTLAANTEYYLYSEGQDATIDGYEGSTYTLVSAFTNAGVSVDITGASLIVSSGKLKLVLGSTAAAVCYITYKEV